MNIGERTGSERVVRCRLAVRAMAFAFCSMPALIASAAGPAAVHDRLSGSLAVESAVFEQQSEFEVLKHLSRQPAFLRLLDARSRAAEPDDDGAVGRNRKRFSDVAAQRDVIWLLLKAVAERDASALDKVVRAMEYAFRFQAADGHFENSLGYDPLRAMTADAFFLQAFGHVYLLLEQEPLAAAYLPRLQRLRARQRKAIDWLRNHRDVLLRQDARAPNRLAFDGLAFLANGKILRDPELKKIGAEFIRANLRNQRSDGVFIEHGGADSSYQAVNALVLEAAWFYLEDVPLKQQVSEAIQKGLAWEETHIEDSGRIMVNGNTRTGLGQEKLFGKVKDVNYPEVALSLFYWAGLGGMELAEQSAAAVTSYAMQDARSR